MLLKPLQIDSVWWERRVYSEISSAVERFSYTEDVTGSNPVFRTMAIDVIEQMKRIHEFRHERVSPEELHYLWVVDPSLGTSRPQLMYGVKTDEEYKIYQRIVRREIRTDLRWGLFNDYSLKNSFLRWFYRHFVHRFLRNQETMKLLADSELE